MTGTAVNLLGWSATSSFQPAWIFQPLSWSPQTLQETRTQSGYPTPGGEVGNAPLPVYPPPSRTRFWGTLRRGRGRSPWDGCPRPVAKHGSAAGWTAGQQTVVRAWDGAVQHRFGGGGPGTDVARGEGSRSCAPGQVNPPNNIPGPSLK